MDACCATCVYVFVHISCVEDIGLFCGMYRALLRNV